MAKKIAYIIGAGPAGLTAAHELLEKTDIHPVILEASSAIGGISKTVNYKGYRIDIGGHRFFSKSDRIMQWWEKVLPLQGKPSWDDGVLGRTVTLSSAADAPDPETTDRVMLVRRRLSRIFFLKKFFHYPISLSFDTLAKLGVIRTVNIAASYLRSHMRPVRPERNLEDFFINRFGRELYKTFFSDYTEKVWGIPCNRIRPEWGAQRIKGLSITKVLLHALTSALRRNRSVSQDGVETSLIEQFLYPKHGPCQMWEEVAKIIREKGGEIRMRHTVVGIESDGCAVTALRVRDEERGTTVTLPAEYVISTMPVKTLLHAFSAPVPGDVRDVAEGLVYRDFITVGVLLRKMKMRNESKIRTVNNIIPDNWIYVQEREVKVGRIQVFNNWSPYLLSDPHKIWIGLEYFCDEGDPFWNMTDKDLSAYAVSEVVRMDMIDANDVLDSVVIRQPKAYPAYFGSYNRFHVIRDYVDRFQNLFLVGRNGMHRYNNMDHSMLSAMIAVENIRDGVVDKENLWSINMEQEYHEKKITAVEQLTEEVLQPVEDGEFQYKPDIYWAMTKDVYPHYPTVRHRRRFIRNAVRSRRKQLSDAFLFDYGCGEGSLLLDLKNDLKLNDAQLGGCDISHEAVAVARKKIASPYIYAEPFPRLPRPCDVIVCCETIEHTPDFVHILRWVKDNLAPGGMLILTTQAGKIHKSDRYTGHTQHFDLPQLRLLLQQMNYRVRYASLWGFPFFTLQKYLTDVSFDHIRKRYLEGRPSGGRMLIFHIAYILFFVHDVMPAGPQIYIIAERPAA